MTDAESIDTAPTFSNADVDWDKFDSEIYFDNNYRELHHEDAQIIGVVADFFQRVAPGQWRPRAIDVGTGANLYPAMTMLPLASEIVLYERAFSNRAWLIEQLHSPAASWARFWLEIQGRRPEYRRISDPMDVLSRTAKVVKGDLFALEPGQYDMGTMFFVAESITSREDEFRRAIRRFVASLVPRAPFAAAFMRESSGYRVGDREFPACSVDEGDVGRCLADVAYIEEMQTVESHDLRDGYDGMIVVCGQRK
ncbi:SCO2525 family SAM-dependent methyltransferase [Dactylosporangium sp. NBC_01737]|uniref:SCO2525 family SAM-dependent methyltransferase n=1 Tax=Dactylosporangium sp. NBC_01737 TaxID=2975959 RepID=UPI002E102559|nr:SCO2525 family SAM-dependent methyltransferase [Dactylosporangium sp. NBC_01737]